MNTTNRARLLAATALMALASLAQAQYMWIDEKGLKQFSDRPPPPSVPLKHILKAPHGVPTAASLAVEPAAAAPAPEAAKPKAAPTVADRNADYNKRVKEKAEHDEKEQAEAERKAALAENCARAREARQSLDSGARIGSVDKNGERGFLSDEQRAVESQKVNKALSACK
jgi:type IV secretory pathway VirB10-like protein